MKLRITYRKNENKIDLTVDTESINQPIYSKEFENEQNAKRAIENILIAAKIDNKEEIVFNETFGNFLFETTLDFTKEEDYNNFCKDILQLETKK